STRLGDEPTSLPALLPGIALLAVVGYAGKLTEHDINTYAKTHHLTFPNIEYVLWAILFGVLLSNTIGLPRIFRAGVATYEFWLKAGIILLGARFVLGDVLKLGGISLGLVFIAITLSILFMTWLGRAFRLSPALTTLLAVGSSICGVSAIIATQGAIDADEDDSATAIAAILALGAISLFAFPLIGHTLHMSDHAYGLWAGLAVDNTAEATAAGALYSDAAGKYAVLAKTCRNALIGFVVLAYAIQWSRRNLVDRESTIVKRESGINRESGIKRESGILSEGGASAAEVEGSAVSSSKLNIDTTADKFRFLWKKFPKFVLGFLFISLLATLGASSNPTLAALGFNKAQLLALGNLSRWAFLLTFAGVGLRTNLRDLFKQGARPFLVSAVGEIVIAVLTLGLILGADRIYHL
ncbi:MAG TPA: putative sulfate exporter family transporter, partial [Edaphobacter sp.]|nr:putative sulfate exporter family transporter [Edaphobacter sp.]